MDSSSTLCGMKAKRIKWKRAKEQTLGRKECTRLSNDTILDTVAFLQQLAYNFHAQYYTIFK